MNDMVLQHTHTHTHTHAHAHAHAHKHAHDAVESGYHGHSDVDEVGREHGRALHVDDVEARVVGGAQARVGSVHGRPAPLLEQEVAKLAALVGDVDTITREDVPKVVGGWRTETTWVMLDAVRDGHPGHAIEALDKLLKSGEAPQKILGGVTFVFRKFAESTERARTGTPLREAIAAAGVFSNAIGQAEAYLRRIGFERASRILQLLVEADSEMKGGSRVDPALLLERLFVRLAGDLTVMAAK